MDKEREFMNEHLTCFKTRGMKLGKRELFFYDDLLWIVTKVGANKVKATQISEPKCKITFTPMFNKTVMSLYEIGDY